MHSRVHESQVQHDVKGQVAIDVNPNIAILGSKIGT
jgi:hypothetical protein